MNTQYYGDDDLLTNTSTRVPFCFCADISGSMERANAEGKKPIDELNKFINDMMSYIATSDGLRDSVEVAIVTFESEVTVVRDFATVAADEAPVELTANGGTALAHGVTRALDILEARKKSYQENHIDYFQPVLVLITDGKPGDMEDLPSVAERTSRMAEDKKISIFPIVIGSDDDEPKWREIQTILAPLSPKHNVMHLRGLKFEELTKFLSKSLDRLVAADPGDDTVQTAAPDIGGGWDEW